MGNFWVKIAFTDFNRPILKDEGLKVFQWNGRVLKVARSGDNGGKEDFVYVDFLLILCKS